MTTHRITTDFGREFDYAAMTVDQIHIKDIARGLSRICRFGGHVRQFYSVAEHSLRVAALCSPENRLRGLLHDASEAYLGDIVAPLKSHHCMAGYRLLERELEALIAQKFGFDGPDLPDEVKRADIILRLTEQRDIRTVQPTERQTTGLEPLEEVIYPMMPTLAEARFLHAFELLTTQAPAP